MTPEAIEARDFIEAIEEFHARGWTDGLPVIPPTAERLAEFLAHAGREAAEEIGFYDMRNRPVTVGKVAINAIMAGCLPEHLPVVIALVECLLEPGVNLHVTRGFTRDASVVTAFTVGNHIMLSNHFEKTPEEWIETVAHYLVGAGRLIDSGFGVLMVPPEAAEMFVAAGWSKQDIAAALFDRSRRSMAWVKQHGWKVGGRFERGGALAPGDEDRMLGVATSPDDILVVICGGPAGNFPTFIQTYSATFEVASREVRLPSAAAGKR